MVECRKGDRKVGGRMKHREGKGRGKREEIRRRWIQERIKVEEKKRRGRKGECRRGMEVSKRGRKRRGRG